MQFFEAKISSPLTHVSSGQFVSPGNWIHSKRTLDSFEVIIGLEGVLYIQQDEEKFQVHPGDVLLLLPHHCHQGYEVCERDTSFYWFHFYCNDSYNVIDPDAFEKDCSPSAADVLSGKFRNSILIPMFSKPESIDKLIIQFKQLLHITTSKYYSPIAADYLLTSIMIELTQQMLGRSLHTGRDGGENDGRFASVLEWIRINIQKDISIDEIAYEFKFNKNYLARLFKKRLGVSIISYINSMKVAKAKELLCRTDKTIKEIAYFLGFNDEKYFMRLFKEYEQLTPTDYRNAFYKTRLNNE